MISDYKYLGRVISASTIFIYLHLIDFLPLIYAISNLRTDVIGYRLALIFIIILFTSILLFQLKIHILNLII